MNQLIARSITGTTRLASYEYDPNARALEGGSGIVFADKCRPGYLIKIYKKFVDYANLGSGTASFAEISEAREKIEAMLQEPPAHQTASDGKSEFTQIAWPQETLTTKDGRFVGFTMREVDFSNSVALEQLFLSQQRSSEGLPQDFEFRLVAAQNLASVVSLVHRKGHAIVDLQPQNVRVYRKNGWVGLIDCDGYRISARKIYPAGFLRDDFAAPELQRSGGNVRPDMGDEYQDRFAVSLLIFSLLNDGITPFHVKARAGQSIPSDVPSRIRDRLYGYGRTPHPLVEPPSAASMHEYFPDQLRDLFDRAFLRDGNGRPTAEEWSDCLRQQLAAAERCRKTQSHGVSVLGGTCMLCAREEAIRELSRRPLSQVSYTRTAPPRPRVAPVPLGGVAQSTAPQMARVTVPPLPSGLTAPGSLSTGGLSTLWSGGFSRLRLPLAWCAGLVAIWWVASLTGSGINFFAPQEPARERAADARGAQIATGQARALEAERRAAERRELEQQQAAAEQERRSAASTTPSKQIATLVDRPLFSPNSYTILLTDVDITIGGGHTREVIKFGSISSLHLRRLKNSYDQLPKSSIEIRGNRARGYGTFLRILHCRYDDAGCVEFYNFVVKSVLDWRAQYGDLASDGFSASPPIATPLESVVESAQSAPVAGSQDSWIESVTPPQSIAEVASPRQVSDAVEALAASGDSSSKDETVCQLDNVGEADQVLTADACLARGGVPFDP